MFSVHFSINNLFSNSFYKGYFSITLTNLMWKSMVDLPKGGNILT